LPSDRVAIFHARITHIARRHAGMACQRPRNPGRVGPGLFDQQQIVFAIAVTVRLETEALVDKKVLGNRANGRSAHRFTVCARPNGNRGGTIVHYWDKGGSAPAVCGGHDLEEGFVAADHAEISARAFFSCFETLLEIDHFGIERGIAFAELLVETALFNHRGA